MNARSYTHAQFYSSYYSRARVLVEDVYLRYSVLDFTRSHWPGGGSVGAFTFFFYRKMLFVSKTPAERD